MQHYRILLLALLLSLFSSQAGAASVNNILRITATTLEHDELARAIRVEDQKRETDDDQDKDDSDEDHPNRMASAAAVFLNNNFEQRIQLTSGQLYKVTLEGSEHQQWIFFFDADDVLIIRKNAQLPPQDYSLSNAILTIAISY